jgi:hypothetical protein
LSDCAGPASAGKSIDYSGTAVMAMAEAGGKKAERSDLWVSRLHAASSAEEIVCIANEFVASWSEPDRARIPAQCLPPDLGTPQDVSTYAFALTQTRLEFVGASSRVQLIERMCAFMSAAAMRIAQLEHWSHAQMD